MPNTTATVPKGMLGGGSTGMGSFNPFQAQPTQWTPPAPIAPVLSTTKTPTPAVITPTASVTRTNDINNTMSHIMTPPPAPVLPAGTSPAGTAGGTPYAQQVGQDQNNGQTTLAQDQARAANQGKEGFDVLGNPIPGYKSPLDQAIEKNGGTTTSNTSTTTSAPTGLTDANNTEITNINAQLQANQAKDLALINNIETGRSTIPLNQDEINSINAIKQQYAAQLQVMQQQQGFEQGKASAYLARTGQSQGSPLQSSMYMTAIVGAAQVAIGKLNAEMDKAVSDMTTAFHQNDAKTLEAAYARVNKSLQDRKDEIISAGQKIATIVQNQQKEALATQKDVISQATSLLDKLGIANAPTDVMNQVQGILANSNLSYADIEKAHAVAAQYLEATGSQTSAIQDFKFRQGLSPADQAAWDKQQAPKPVSLGTGATLVDPKTGAVIAKGTPRAAAGSSSGGSGAPGVIGNDVQAVLEGRNTMFNIRQTMGRSKEAQAYMEQMRSQIAKTDPNFDFVASDAGGKSQSSAWLQKSQVALDTVAPNIDKIIALSDDVNRTNVQYTNKKIFDIASQFSGVKTTNLQEAQGIIADELGVALGAGQVSDAKLALGQALVNINTDPATFKQNMNLLKGMLANRRSALSALRYKSPTVGDKGVDSGSHASGGNVVNTGKTATGNGYTVTQH